jgi:ribose transport system substrate-binding protein
MQAKFEFRFWLPCIAAALLAGCAENIPVEPATPAANLGAPANTPESASDRGADQKTSGRPAPAAASKEGSKRLIILTNGNSPFWDAARAGMYDAEEDLQLASADYLAVFEVNNGTAEGQLDKLKQFGSQSDVAGIAVSITSADNVAIAEELRKLRQKGVAVVTVDSDVDRQTMRDARSAFVGTDNFQGGRALGLCAQALRPEGGKYVAFFGIAGAQNVIERTSGFVDGAGDQFLETDLMADDLDLPRARDNVRNAIRNHPDLNVLVGIWSYNAPAIVDVVVELDRRDDFTIVTFDAEPGAISAMGNGNIDAMVVQNPYAMGYESIRLLKALASDDQAAIKEMLPRIGQVNGDIYDTGLKVVVPNADSPISKDRFPKNVEYLTLEEFQAWLDKYGLTGS